MRGHLIRQFGERLRARIKSAGYSNVSTLLTGLGINMTFISKMTRGTQTDAGVMKIAQIAIMLGRRPSELVAELDELLLDPEPVDQSTFDTLGLPGRLESYDTNRLAIVVDVVLAWKEEGGIDHGRERIAALIASLYDDFVGERRNIKHLELRRLVTAAVFGIELPEPEAKPRGRGRPPSSAAA